MGVNYHQSRRRKFLISLLDGFGSELLAQLPLPLWLPVIIPVAIIGALYLWLFME